MQVNVIKEEGCSISYEVKIPSAEYEVFKKAAYKAVAEKASAPGFRKGHLPKTLVLKNYGRHIEEEARNIAINESIGKASAETKVKVLPESIAISAITPTSEYFSYTCVAECIPSVAKKDIKNTTVELVKVSIADSDVDDVIERMRKQHAKWQVEDDAVVDDDTTANIDFLGKKDGVPFSGGDAKGFNLNINTTKMIPGFVESIKGHKAGDSFTINVTFPEDYAVEELKGAPATFDITVNSVSKQVLPEVNEDFLKIFGFEGKGLDAFKNTLKSNLEQQVEVGTNSLNLDRLFEGIKSAYPEISAPRSMVMKMAESMMNTQFQGKVDERIKSALLPSFIYQAEKRALEQILFNGLLEAEGASIELKDEDINAQIEKASISYDDPEEFKAEVRNDKALFQSVCAYAANIKMVNFLAGLVTTTTVEKSFEEFSEMRAQKESDEQAKMLEQMKVNNTEAAV